MGDIVIKKEVIGRDIKAILFDLDGTLLDTEALSDKAMLAVLSDVLPTEVLEECASHGYRLPWELKKQILGLRGSDWAPLVISYARDKWHVPTNNLPMAMELWRLWEDKLNEYCSHIEACPGVTELVEGLSAAGIPMAIATSSRAASVQKKCKRHGRIFERMNAVVPGDDPRVKEGKPSPDIYLEAARQLSVDPSQCLVFEDALSGVRSAKAAGCFVVAVPDSRFTSEEKMVFASEVDLVLDSLCHFDGSLFGIQTNNGNHL